MLACQSSLAQTPGGQRGAAPVALDIPAQPLERALKQFGAAAGVELFYESSVVYGRRSTAINGVLPAEGALRLLLRNTGLSSTSFDRGTMTILPPAEADLAPLDRARAQVVEFAPYLARLQRSMDRAFCGETSVAHDADDVLARLWIAPSGKVSRTELLSGTGSDDRDRAYVAMIGAVDIGTPPPASMPQPVNMMINVRASRLAQDCGRWLTNARSAPHE